MKKFLLYLLTLSLLSLSSIANAKSIRIGTEGAYPPWNNLNAAGELEGAEIDFGNEACKRMNVECEWVTQDWDGIIPALLNGKYDIIIANATYEHVKEWEAGLENIFNALKDGGLLYFVSTNKFSFISGEYPKIPLYGWLPNSWRYFLRINLQAKDIMEWGIDFHQFTFFQLRRYFKKLGFKSNVQKQLVAQLLNLSNVKQHSIMQ